MTGSAWWARPGIPWSHTWGLIFPSHSFWSLSIGEGVMSSSVVTRSCRALGAEKLSITRVVPSLVSTSLPIKGVGHSVTTRNWWENICSSQQQRSAWVNILVVVFSCSTQNGTGLGGEGSGVGDQDRVGSPRVNQGILRPTCYIQLHTWLQPLDGYLCVCWRDRAASVLLNHPEGRLDA